MKQKNEEEKADLLSLCKKWKLQLVKEHYYSLFEGDIERVIYVIKKLSYHIIPWEKQIYDIVK